MVPTRPNRNWFSLESGSSVWIWVFISSSRDLPKLSRVWAATTRKDWSFPWTSTHRVHTEYTTQHQVYTQSTQPRTTCTHLVYLVRQVGISKMAAKNLAWSSWCPSGATSCSLTHHPWIVRAQTTIRWIWLTWRRLTSATQLVMVSSLEELLHSRLQAAEPMEEQKSACCCSSDPLCHSWSRSSSFSCTTHRNGPGSDLVVPDRNTSC